MECGDLLPLWKAGDALEGKTEANDKIKAENDQCRSRYRKSLARVVGGLSAAVSRKRNCSLLTDESAGSAGDLLQRGRKTHEKKSARKAEGGHSGGAGCSATRQRVSVAIHEEETVFLWLTHAWKYMPFYDRGRTEGAERVYPKESFRTSVFLTDAGKGKTQLI